MSNNATADRMIGVNQDRPPYGSVTSSQSPGAASRTGVAPPGRTCALADQRGLSTGAPASSGAAAASNGTVRSDPASGTASIAAVEPGSTGPASPGCGSSGTASMGAVSSGSGLSGTASIGAVRSS